MITGAQTPRPAPSGPAAADDIEIGPGLFWLGLLAGGVACGVVLAAGIGKGVPAADALAYGGLALLYLALTLSVGVSASWRRWVWRRLWAYLLIMGGISLALQALSGEAFLQPIVFTIPIVHAALVYPLRRAIAVCALYLGLMNLGIWLSGDHDPTSLIFPTIGYITLMTLIVAFSRLSVDQSQARQRADDLATDLARQRDYLA